VAANNQNVGAGYIERNGQQFLVRVPGQVADLARSATSCWTVAKACRSACATWRGGRRPGTAHRCGHQNGEEVVLGTVFMLVGANSREVAQAARLPA
jgi:cobalt-zinc-cadmium resistance protein CzcA